MNGPPGRDVRWRERLHGQRKEEQITSQVAKQTSSMKLLR